MYIKPILLLSLFTLFCTCALAQNSTQENLKKVRLADSAKVYWGKASITGRSDNFAVTPTGAIWIGTANGSLWHADSASGSWSVEYFREDEFDGEHFEQTHFFNESVGILTGYLHDDNYNDHYYRTINGGRTWRKHAIEKGKWIDAADVLPSGFGWFASSDQVMYRTKDAGATWEEIRRPEDNTNQRIVALDFLNEKVGLAGTGWNRLYLTEDGGDSDGRIVGY